MENQEFKSVTELDLASLKEKSINKLWLKIMENGISEPMRIPIVVLKGAKKGPVFGVTAVVHGNEINGIGVIHKLIKKIDLKSLSGTIVCVLVSNVPGFLKKTRNLSQRVDLNHIMPGKKNGNTSEQYAYLLFNKIVKKFDYLVDLHTASKGRLNTLYVRADLSVPVIYKMATHLGPEIVLHNPPNDKTLRGAASKAGIPSVTLEVGNPSRFQEKYINRSVKGIYELIIDAKMISKKGKQSEENCIHCESSKWIYTDGGGILEVSVDLADIIKKGDVIATLKNIFGDLIKVYKAPSDGVIIGKSADPVAETGSRIIHLGKVSEAKKNRRLSQ